MDHFDEGDSAFSLKAETNVPCGNVSAQINLSSDPSGCERSISSIVQNRIIAKGYWLIYNVNLRYFKIL